MPISAAEWQSIHNAISRSDRPPAIKHSTVTKRDKKNRKVWLHDYGDDPVRMASFDYEISFHDAQTGTIQKALLRPKIPDVGDTVLVNESMGSRNLPRITGVVPKKPKTYKDYIFAARAPDAPAATPGVPPGAMMFYGWVPNTTALTEIPAGYFMCNGAALSRTTYPALFSAIGAVYGAGDGSTTFNLPNLRDGFVLVGGATIGYNLAGGATTHTLSEAEMPTHRHNYEPDGVPLGLLRQDSAGAYVFQNVASTHSWTTRGATQYAGSGGAHNNMPPYRSVGGVVIKY
jgi:microcystin-dependent protein